MEQQHHHQHQSGLSVAFWLNLSFSVVEVIGGILTNSTAIIADAFHDFIDALAIGVAVVLEKISGKKRTQKFSYGYKRFSLLAALGMSIFLLIGAVIMSISAFHSFANPKTVNSVGMLGLALVGIAVNGIAFLRIKNGNGHHHGHTHQHGHGTTHHNSRAIMLHLLEDVLGWVAVLVGAVVIYFTGWFWVDGLLTLAIAVFIFYNAGKNLWNAMKVLLQAVPDHVDVEKLTYELKHIEGVEDVHDVHVWSLDGSYHIASLHAVLNPVSQRMNDDIFSAITQLMKKYHIQHPTIQFETTANKCMLVNC